MKQKSKTMQKMNCIVCLDDQNELFKEKTCKCQFCYNCALNWIEEKIAQKQQIESFSCLNHKCKQMISLQIFFNSIKDQDIKLQYQEIMLKNYLQITQDIRPCPNPLCNEYAFLPNTRCQKEFQCRQCDNSWLDKHYLSYEKLIILKITEFRSNASSDVFEFFRTQECPKCDTKILKNGGCSHMTCKKCNFYYCWLCNNDLKNHSDTMCFFRVFTYLSILISNLINTLYLLGWLKYLSQIVYPIYGIFLLILYNSYPFLPIIIICTIVYTLKQKNKLVQYQRKRFLHNQIVALVIEFVLLLLLILVTIFDVFDITMSQFILYHCYQETVIGIAALIGLTVYSFNYFIYRDWLKYLI